MMEIASIGLQAFHHHGRENDVRRDKQTIDEPPPSPGLLISSA